jgi:hypothetical protein
MRKKPYCQPEQANKTQATDKPGGMTEKKQVTPFLPHIHLEGTAGGSGVHDKGACFASPINRLAPSQSVP